MGIQVEFNPDLALRAHGTSGRLLEECLPEKLEVGKMCPFQKKGQRNYWIQGEIPLVITEGEGKLSRPVASVTILQVLHYMKGNEVWTTGTYKINEVYDIDKPEIHFEGFQKR